MVPQLTREVVGVVTVVLVVGLMACSAVSSPRYTVVAAGLHHPRGIAFGPAGEMYVSEAGFPDESESDDRSTREFTTGRLSVIDRQYQRRSLLENLPTRYYPLASQLVGPAGLAVLPQSKGVRLLLAYGQCGAPVCGSVIALEVVNGAVVGSPTRVANLQAIVDANPSSGGDTSAPEGETNPWGIAAADGGAVYVVDSSANHLVVLTPREPTGFQGQVLASFARNPVPTGAARSPDGHVYVALFGHLPHQPSSGQIVAVAPDGGVRVVADGLNSPIAVATDGEAVYALEFASHYDFKENRFVPRTGRILRVDTRRHVVVADGLDFPTALAVGPDNALYVAVNGAFSEPGAGEIIRLQP